MRRRHPGEQHLRLIQIVYQAVDNQRTVIHEHEIFVRRRIHNLGADMDRGIEDASSRKRPRQAAATVQQMGKAQFAPKVLVVVKPCPVEAESEGRPACRNGSERRHA
ncbi:hypothetical protein D9M72_640880 [compost metagenome]